MNYSPKLEQAIRFAARKHDGQLRKDQERLPYISHLVSAAVLVSNTTDDEDVIIAALLHDTLEDTETKEEELEKIFGARVLELVRAVTLERNFNGRELSWHEQKERELERLKKAPAEALDVALADKIHNGTSRLLAQTEGDAALIEQFAARREDYVHHNEELLVIARERLPHSKLIKELERIIQEESKL